MTTPRLEKRMGHPPIPERPTEFLTDLQRIALTRIENFGWKLKFIRRPLFQTPLVVVENAVGKKIGVLEEDGELNLKTEIFTLRESA
ncbi:hypothetical protein IB286_00740 [Spongiibacter sp. KMU-158]|uniref:Uncharacterized protein n=1 Tax=Spongiibacter pelagi TaxID=2760804 RepID=A0A927BZP7_9GAMM|nr:hypothetical protein [Spongiibacter pelagi]MBD2857513.1 hypothetical protein [Spongiibacter pelagi]